MSAAMLCVRGAAPLQRASARTVRPLHTASHCTNKLAALQRTVLRRRHATAQLSTHSHTVSLRCHSHCQSTTQPRRSFSSSGGKKVVVLADHDNKKLGEATLKVISAAKQLQASAIVVVIAGKNAKAVAEKASKVQGVTEVVLADDEAYEHLSAENVAELLHQYHKSAGFDYLLASGSSDGKNIIPRVAALLNVQPINEIAEIKDSNTYVRPIYAGNVLATVKSSDKIQVATIRPTNFDAVTETQSEAAKITDYKPDGESDKKLSSWVKDELSKSERPELGSAKVVVSGGRGVKSGENFKILYDLADLMGGAVGASRAAVDAGYVPNDMQVGQTGKVVAPELYIAAGISGAIQHLAGMKDSKVIVAINKDPEAPIFSVADYGLPADLFKAVPELTEKIKQAKGQ